MWSRAFTRRHAITPRLRLSVTISCNEPFIIFDAECYVQKNANKPPPEEEEEPEESEDDEVTFYTFNVKLKALITFNTINFTLKVLSVIKVSKIT